MGASGQNVQEQLRTLNKIGIALSSERNLQKLLSLILREARRFTHADAGSLYIRQGNSLTFIVAQNDTLGSRQSAQFNEQINLPLNKKSIAGYAAVTGKTLNINNAYHLPNDAEYTFHQELDKEHHYRTKSILAVPLKDPDGEIAGVLELINAFDENNEVIPFPSHLERLVESLASQAAVSIRNANLLEELKKAHLHTILRLCAAAEYKDKETAGHLERISVSTAILAAQMGLPKTDVELLKHASPMHDIGKLGIPDAILTKPGQLTPEEYEIMKKHAVFGSEILGESDLKLFTVAREIALTHHEKFDGTGYPKGLKGIEIPLHGRIVAVADVFDALNSNRVYRKALPIEKSLEVMREQERKHFDPTILRAFFDSLDDILKTYSIR